MRALAILLLTTGVSVAQPYTETKSFVCLPDSEAYMQIAIAGFKVIGKIPYPATGNELVVLEKGGAISVYARFTVEQCIVASGLPFGDLLNTLPSPDASS